MTTKILLPDSFSALSCLDLSALRHAHDQGRCPNPSELDGIAEGLILDPIWFERLRLWRGKVFKAEVDGKIHGINRLGFGPMEFHRYRFSARKIQSAFSVRDVILLDHDLPENPSWVRRYHDELVEMRRGLYLTCSHFKMGGRLRYASYFAFDFGHVRSR